MAVKNRDWLMLGLCLLMAATIINSAAIMNIAAMLAAQH